MKEIKTGENAVPTTDGGPLAAVRDFDIPNPFKVKTVLDFELCVGLEELKQTVHEINRCGFVFLTATQSGEAYTVFFWRHLV